MIPHQEFMKEAAEANKVGSRTKDFMGPETEEDHAMYNDNVPMDPELFDTGEIEGDKNERN